MNVIRGLFGKGKNKPAEPVSSGPSDPSKDPNLIRVFDAYGRELFVKREQWRDILLDTLKKHRDNSDRLYEGLAGLRDGFVADLLPYAQRLFALEPCTARAAIVLGIVYLETKRLDQAQRVLERFTVERGDDGIVLANLAKVYSAQGKLEKSRETLWHALEIDPNQDNGLAWYVALERERGGEAAATSAWEQVSKISGSWRASLWLARAALERKDLAEALRLYNEALSAIAVPLPSDLLMQISGDLGRAGRLAELIELVEPRFDVAAHGLPVGNNLIKAHLDLGQLEAAKRVLEELYAQKRPDWQRALTSWDTKIAEAAVAQRGEHLPPQIPIEMTILEGPVWGGTNSPFRPLLPEKRTDAPRVAVLGSTVLFTRAVEAPRVGLADAPGRLSRAIPLLVVEQLHLRTEGVAETVQPWAEPGGFAVLGQPYSDEDLLAFANKMNPPVDVVIGIVIDTTEPHWKIIARILRQSGWRAETSVVLEQVEQPGSQVVSLANSIIDSIVAKSALRAIAPPTWYQLPNDMTDYLLRAEQHLATAFASFKNGALSGERELVAGTLQLCLREPGNSLVRMLLVRTLQAMKKTKPQVIGEFKDKLERLHLEFPLLEPVAIPLREALREILS